MKVFPHYQATLNRLWRIAAPGIRMDLKPMQILMDAIGRPCRFFPSILIAGTNGKGSTASMLSEILFHSGYRVGLYTSPHLNSYRERIVIKDRKRPFPFNEEAWCRNFARVEDGIFRLGISLTQFEILTALSFCIFQDEKVDVAVLEVGVGGRLDATNVVEPVLTLITSIDQDHQDLLGDTLPKIAREKAGIFRRNVPALTVTQIDEVLDLLAAEAKRKGTELSCIPPGELENISLDSQSFSYYDASESNRRVRTVRERASNTVPKVLYKGRIYKSRLVGEHQVRNASLAIEGGMALRRQGFSISDEAVAKGIETADWPCRFEILRHEPCIIVDGAHNPAGANALSSLLLRLDLPRPHVLALGILAGKDSEGILQAFSPWGDEWIFCRSFSNRAIDSQELLMKAKAIFPHKKMTAKKRVGEACRHALSLAENIGTVCIAGSLTVAGEARRLLKKR